VHIALITVSVRCDELVEGLYGNSVLQLALYGAGGPWANYACYGRSEDLTSDILARKLEVAVKVFAKGLRWRPRGLGHSSLTNYTASKPTFLRVPVVGSTTKPSASNALTPISTSTGESSAISTMT